jgi:branched-chain amino acid transport system permease protein
VTPLLLLEQSINGLQLGMMLFLIAAGLTLVLGIMNLVNLTHGSLFMMGAYFCATLIKWSGSFMLGVALALVAVAVLGVLVEFLVLRYFYERDHLDQVLATFGMILFFNELVKILWGPASIFMEMPAALSGQIEIVQGLRYPAYRLLLVGVGATVAVGLWWLIAKTRVGMLIRAGSTHRQIVAALGVNVQLLFTLVFGLGAALAGFAGMMTSPLYVVQIGMGDGVLIQAFVVIVIGGIGSVRGAFAGALIVGLVDTFGRILPPMYGLPSALSEVAVYGFMAAVLFWRPGGLFPAQGH